jgi:hypothetical protein
MWSNQLAYASQFEPPWKWPLRRVNKLKQRLGIDVGSGDPFPKKPKGMWARTFDYLLAEMLQAEILAREAQANMFKRLAQIKTTNRLNPSMDSLCCSPMFPHARSHVLFSHVFPCVVSPMFSPGWSELVLAWWSTGSNGSWRSSRTILNEV